MPTMWTVIIKNQSGSNQIVEDLGLEFSPGDVIEITNLYNYDEIAGSDDLRTMVAASDLTVNDGTVDLSPAQGVKFLSLENLYRLESDYYSKDELKTDNQGSVEVHWNNVINAPSFGSVVWGRPVKARVTSIASGKPATPTLNDICVDTDDNHLYKWIGSSWIDIYSAIATEPIDATPSKGTRVVNLADDQDDVFEFDNTGNWNEDPAVDNDCIMVDDDGDGKAAQYIYNGAAYEWRKIADVDFASHFNGESSKHDATEIDVEGSYSDIPGTPMNLEQTINEINNQITNIENTTLDLAYDQGGAGNGRQIIADAGPIKVDTASSTNAPLELVPKANLPTQGLQDGQLAVKDSILCIYDSVRSKWLSVQRQFLVFGRKGNSRNQYLGFFGSRFVSNNSGLRLARSATIVSLSGQVNAVGDCTFNVRRNDVATNIASIAITAALGASDTSMNVDLNNGDYLQGYLSAVSIIEDPIIIIEIAWRL